MNKLKKLPIFAFGLTSLLLASCGSNITHTINCYIKHYSADLNHDGVLSDKEKNLTWTEAYSTLLAQTTSTEYLEKYADTMNISTDEATKSYRTNLARYEILHQAEELAMSTGAVMPLYNYEDSFLIKEDIKGTDKVKNPHGMYSSSLGYKFFERMYRDNGNNNFNVCVGSKAETMDPTKNSTVEAATMIAQSLMGAQRWVPIGTKEKPFEAGLEDGICTCEKTIDETKGNAIWTFTIKDGAKWQDGTAITADDFIWSWNRAASSSAGTSFSSMFDCVLGYDDIKDEEGKVIVPGWHNIEDPTSYDGYGRNDDEEATPIKPNSKGGMYGLRRLADNKFKAILTNDCAYFTELLAFPSFMPLPRHTMCDNLEKENEEIETLWWQGTETEKTKKGHYFCGNGPLKFTKINNTEGGEINLVKNDKYVYKDEVTTDSLSFKLIDDDSSMLTQYKTKNGLCFIDSIAAGSIDQMKKDLPNEFLSADQTAIYYFLFNVNDNTFDMGWNQGDDVDEGKRENLRWVMNLLINRNDICTNVGKSGQTPSSGFVSDGVIETCLPKLVEVGKEVPNSGGKIAAKPDGSTATHVWCIDLNTEGKPNTADWQTRNTAFSGFNCSTPRYNVFEDRTDPVTKGLKEYKGFFPTYSGKKDGKEVPSSDPEYIKEVKNCSTYNMKLARKLAEQSGIHSEGNDDNFKFTNFPQVKLTMNAGTGHEQVGEKMQYYYGLFGIKLVIETQEWNSFCAAKRKGNFAFARNGWTADYRDPRTYLDVCESTNSNDDFQLGRTEDMKDPAYIHKSK